MKKLILCLFILLGTTLYAQVGVGTASPNVSTQLDVVATNKGILIPRVPLKSTTDATTITNGNVNSLLVFNTATIADIKPGYYYWYVGKWHRRTITATNNSPTIPTIQKLRNYSRTKNNIRKQTTIQRILPNCWQRTHKYNTTKQYTPK